MRIKFHLLPPKIITRISKLLFLRKLITSARSIQSYLKYLSIVEKSGRLSLFFTNYHCIIFNLYYIEFNGILVFPFHLNSGKQRYNYYYIFNSIFNIINILLSNLKYNFKTNNYLENTF